MPTPIEGCNTAVLAGTLSSEPRTTELASGSVLVRLEVTTRAGADEPADSVPVAWFDPPSGAAPLRAGDAVVVVGRVRRRWWGGPGGARSATEVVAATVLPARRRAAARRALQAVAEGLVPAGL